MRKAFAGNHVRDVCVIQRKTRLLHRIPGLLIGLVGLHLLMVLKLGVNEWPMPGRLVRKAT